MDLLSQNFLFGLDNPLTIIYTLFYYDVYRTKIPIIASSRLQQFKRKGDYLWNFRCPYCGDSQTNKTKARGYVFRKESNLIYKCHNCGIGANLNNFLKHLDSQLHDDYIKEKYLDNGKDKEVSEKFDFKPPPHLKGNSPLKSKLLKKISSLDHNHYAKIYVQKRKIPSDKHYLLYHTESFNKWSNEWCPKKLDTNNDCARLIIPCHDESNKFIACQGRSYDNNDFKLRYQTSKVHEDTQLIFGQDRLKSDKTRFAVEGQLIHYSWIIVLPSLVLINLRCYPKIQLSYQITTEEILTFSRV